MKVMDESFDNELSRRLKQFSEEPEGRLWPSISDRIEAEDRAVRLQKKIRIGWIFILGSIMVGGIFYFFNFEPQANPSLVTTGTKQQMKDSMPHASVTPDGNLQRLQKKVDVREIEGRHPGQNKRDLNSNFSLARKTVKTEIGESVKNTSEKQNGPFEFPDNQSEMSTGTNPSQRKAGTSDSINSLTPVKTEPVKKRDGDKQESANREKKQSRLSLYFTIMPTLGYQRIEPNSQDNLIVESIDRISTFSMDRLGFRAELGAEYPLANRLYFFGGLLYFQREQTIGYTEKVVSNTEVSQGPDGEIILQPEFSYQDKSFEYKVQNLGLQVGLSYQLSKKKFLQTLGSGVEFHLALNKVEKAPEFTNNPSAYVFYNLYYRLQYPTDKKLRAVVQPTLNYSFYINQNRDAPFYVKPYGLGLNIGFTYNLK